MRRRQPTNDDPSRRDFFRTAACAALSTTSLISTVWDLRMVNAAVADKLGPRAGVPGYKAMVCIFLGGGNDANNMVVVPSALTGGPYLVHYTLDSSGLVKDVWILRPEEAAVQPWPKTRAEAAAWRFDPVGQVWTRP